MLDDAPRVPPQTCVNHMVKPHTALSLCGAGGGSPTAFLSEAAGLESHPEFLARSLPLRKTPAEAGGGEVPKWNTDRCLRASGLAWG